MTKQHRPKVPVLVFVRVNPLKIDWDIGTMVYHSGDLVFHSEDSAREWFTRRAIFDARELNTSCETEYEFYEKAAALIHVVQPHTQDGKTAMDIPCEVMANMDDFMCFWAAIALQPEDLPTPTPKRFMIKASYAEIYRRQATVEVWANSQQDAENHVMRVMKQGAYTDNEEKLRNAIEYADPEIEICNDELRVETLE